MQSIFSKINFFFLSLFIFLIPLQTVYIFRQGPIGQDSAAREGVWQFGTLALYATDILFLLIFLCTVLRIVLLIRTQEMRKYFFAEISKIKKEPIFISLVLLLCIAFLSISWSSDKILAVQAAFRLFEGVIVFFLLSRMSFARWSMLAWVFVIGACMQAVFGAVQFFMQEIFAVPWLGIAHHAPWILGDAVVESGEVRWLRVYGSFPHPNILAAYLVAGYFFCMAIVSRSEKKIQTWLATLASACILFGLVLTFSREAWLGLAGGLGVMGILSVYKKRICHSRESGNPRGINKILDPRSQSGMTERKEEIKNTSISPFIFFFLIGFVTIVFSGLLFSEPLSVRLGIGGWNRLEVKSVQERIGSVKEFLSLSPALVRGIGMGQYTNTLYQKDVKNNAVRSSYAYQPVHNVFLLVFAELGIVGAVVFLGFLFLLILTWRGKKSCHPRLDRGSSLYYRETSSFPVKPDPALPDAILGMTKISFALLSSFIIISFFDHFFWTIHGGILLWWVALSGLDRKGQA